LKMEEGISLFGKVMQLENSVVCIHGMFHDSPLLTIPREIKQDINKKLSGCNVLCEDGFSYWLFNATSFNEIAHFGIKASAKTRFLALKNYFYNQIRPESENPLLKKLANISSLEEMSELRDEFLSRYPAEPEGMNYILNKSGNGRIDKIEGNPPLRIKRYIYEAQQTLKYLEDSKCSKLHVVVGLEHELPLEYLLKNKNILKQGSFRK